MVQISLEQEWRYNTVAVLSDIYMQDGKHEETAKSIKEKLIDFAVDWAQILP